MKVFISWSGDLSKKLGEAFRNWLPSVLQKVRPYFTPNDIEKGARWSAHIANELEEAKFGVFCLTRENLSSSWIMFEAGAISKVVGEAHVCPILFGLEPGDVTGPLSQFQLARFTKEDMHKLICTINEECGEDKLPDQTRDSVFEMWWPQLESEVSGVMAKYTDPAATEVRSDREILEEVLSLTRLLAKDRDVMSEAVRRRRIMDILNDYAYQQAIPTKGAPTLGELIDSLEGRKAKSEGGGLLRQLAKNSECSDSSESEKSETSKNPQANNAMHTEEDSV